MNKFIIVGLLSMLTAQKAFAPVQRPQTTTTAPTATPAPEALKRFTRQELNDLKVIAPILGEKFNINAFLGKKVSSLKDAGNAGWSTITEGEQIEEQDIVLVPHQESYAYAIVTQVHPGKNGSKYSYTVQLGENLVEQVAASDIWKFHGPKAQ